MVEFQDDYKRNIQLEKWIAKPKDVIFCTKTMLGNGKLQNFLLIENLHK